MASDQRAPGSGATVDPRYFAEAISWENDVIRTVKRSRAVAWFVALLMASLAAMALVCLALLLPLKSFEPYVVEVDRTTGFLEIKRALAPGDLDQSEAVTAMSVVRYLRARETYDPPAIKDNFELAQLLSTGDAARELVELYSPANVRNPVRLLGRGATVAIGIKSIQFPNQRTAIVRFSTRERSATSAITSHWTALIRFRYTRAPMRNEWRFDNPLGFQVTEYRRDQESAPTTEPVPGTAPATVATTPPELAPLPEPPMTGSVP